MLCIQAKQRRRIEVFNRAHACRRGREEDGKRERRSRREGRRERRPRCALAPLSCYCVLLPSAQTAHLPPDANALFVLLL
jgi:hypothetical protein